MDLLDYRNISFEKEETKLNQIFERLKRNDDYLWLFSGISNEEIFNIEKKYNVTLPNQYKRFLQLCNGGYLFDTLLLSSNAEKKIYDLFRCNDNNIKKDYKIPLSYLIIAIESFGDYICFKFSNSAEKNVNVVQWDHEKNSIASEWESFEDWLNEEIDIAESLIQEGSLEPLPAKLELKGKDNE